MVITEEATSLSWREETYALKELGLGLKAEGEKKQCQKSLVVRVSITDEVSFKRCQKNHPCSAVDTPSEEESLPEEVSDCCEAAGIRLNYPQLK